MIVSERIRNGFAILYTVAVFIIAFSLLMRSTG